MLSLSSVSRHHYINFKTSVLFFLELLDKHRYDTLSAGYDLKVGMAA